MCFHEPPIEGEHVVRFQANCDLVIHAQSKFCNKDYPHHIKDCGEFEEEDNAQYKQH